MMIGGHCCVCSRVCMHVGSASYCAEHRPAWRQPAHPADPPPNVTVITAPSTNPQGVPYVPTQAFGFDAYAEKAAQTDAPNRRHISPHVGHILYYALGAASEGGEIAGKAKRIIRDDGAEITDARREELLDECGDVLWYLTRLADALGSSLEEVARKNNTKLADRAERGVVGGSGDKR